MLWLGDNMYLREPDWTSRSGINSRYRKSRADAALQPFLASTSHYAIWDDHDFGSNDSDWTFARKDDSLDLFRMYWPNPSAGLPNAKGVFFKFTWGDAEFFMLDDRYHRTPKSAPNGSDKTMLGKAQMDWLCDSLSSSLATFKIVACGNQVLNTGHVYEKMADYPADRERLLSEITRRSISGVLFLSGDRHHSEIIAEAVSGGGGRRVLYDFTCSPLLSSCHPWGAEEHNPHRVPGTGVNDTRNFGLLRVSGKLGQRRLAIQCIAADGTMKFEHTLTEQDLKAP
jgi:alkaline phosphatase D